MSGGIGVTARLLILVVLSAAAFALSMAIGVPAARLAGLETGRALGAAALASVAATSLAVVVAGAWLRDPRLEQPRPSGGRLPAIPVLRVVAGLLAVVFWLGAGHMALNGNPGGLRVALASLPLAFYAVVGNPRT